jgi:hypothetical protein
MPLTLSAGRRRRSASSVALLSFAAALSTLGIGIAVPLPAAARQEQAAAAAPPSGLAVGQATWDENYLYFVFRVDDTNIVGTNNRPMSNPEQDDSVGVYLQVGGGKPGTPDAQTHAMIVSAAGGFTFLDGDPAAKAFTPKPVFTVKFGVTTQGTLNRADDRDRNYTVSLAVPWTALGLDPKTLKPGTEIGFTAVARSREAQALTALAPGVTSEADVANPSKWGRLVLAAPDAKALAEAGVLTAPRVAPKQRPPLINGVFNEEEWPAASRLAWASPDKPKPQVVVAAARPADYSKEDETAPALRFDKPLSPMQKLVMARYRIDYQADKRKVTVPGRGVFGEDGSLLLKDQPATGLGPWFSSDRPSWHRAEMAAMRKAGIDVALVQIGGPEAADALMDEKAVLALVAALREMAAAGIPTPLLAPEFDTARLGPANEKPDLSQAKGRDLLYAAVRRWVRLVPPEFRARVILPQTASPASALVNAYPVFLGDAAGVTGLGDDVWTDTVRARFAKDYGVQTGGTTLLFAGVGSGWDAAGGKVVASLPGATGKGSGPLATYVVQPGCAANNAPFVARRDGAAYKESWEAAVAAQPTWIIIDSWNDFTRGTEVTASRQYGLRYTDLTRIYTIQAAGLPERAVRWLAHDAPRRLRPGQVVTTTVTVENVGATLLRGSDGIALTYRWLQNGKVVAEGPLKLPLTGGLLPTRSAQLPIGLAAVTTGPDGRPVPLPAGEYVAEIDLTETKGDALTGATTYFGETGSSTPLRVSVTVAPDVADYVQIASTTTPALMVGNSTYPTLVRVRWMGAEPLAADAAALVYQVLTEDGATTVKTGTIELPGRLTPGQWVTIPAKIETAEAGLPVPPAYPEQRGLNVSGAVAPGGYRVRWLLTRTQAVDPIPGEYDEEVAVYPPDDIAVIAPPKNKNAQAMDSAALVPVEVTVTNRGATKWAKGSYAVGYHWYDPDGIETVWKPVVSTPLTKDLGPGESVKVAVNVRAPLRDGAYILAFDVLRTPDAYLSTRPVTSGNDLALVPVRVSGGPLTFVDLTHSFDVDALAPETSAKDGDFDAAGATYPAESFPPDRYGIVAYLAPDADAKKQDFTAKAAYPSGFYCQTFSSARETAFKYGSDVNGAKNALACTGFTVPVAQARYYGLHIAAAASGGSERPFPVTLRYKDGTTSTVTRKVADWNHLPGPNDAAALSTRVKRTAEGDRIGQCSVWHVVVPVDVTKELVGIALPHDKAIKVFAITLERSR